MKKSIIAAVIMSLGAITAKSAELGDVNTPIKLAINEWTGQHVTTHIAGEMLKEAGYKVEYTTAGYYNMYQAMADGDIHAALEIWSSNVPEQYGKHKDEGGIEEFSDLGLDAREGVAYPEHVEDICPGLPDWNALKKCAEKFATAETLPHGRLVDYPADWGSPGADRFTGLELPFKAVPAGSEGALIAEMKAADAKKSPLLVTFWYPHWAMAKYNMKFVNLPAGESACYEDPAWGTNKNAVNDCDFLPTRIFKAGWHGFKNKWPAAYEILKKYKLSDEQQKPMLIAIDHDKGKLEDVVGKWMKDNKSSWKPIVDAATR